MTKSAAQMTIDSMKKNVEQITNGIESAITDGVKRLMKERNWCAIGQILDNLEAYLPSDSTEYKVLSYVYDMVHEFNIGGEL